MYEKQILSKDHVRSQLPLFREKTQQFLDGTVNMKEYKGFSGKYGSYAQRGGKNFMLRLRMTAGSLPKEKLDFIVEMGRKHNVNPIHFTTCQAVQLHNLETPALFEIMDKALDADIVCYGGGGDFPRNVMCSPTAGVDPDEYFDVQPWALAAADYLMNFIDAEKMPRKLKVAFSGSPKNASHATFRDLGFVACPDGTFDVYAAGGLGVNPRLGVKVAEHVAPKDILYYISAMRSLFLDHGNYTNRTKARTRFMVDTLGGPEAFRKTFQEYVKKAYEQDLELPEPEQTPLEKAADGEPAPAWNVFCQKQPGLYMVKWHPLGGSPALETLEKLSAVIADMPGVQLRIDPDESCWIVNLTGKEADQVQAVIAGDNARNPFETSVSCIGASICQVGVRDSQDLLAKSIQAVREADLPGNALPQIHISGCPSSCGTHQAGTIGFRGGVKLVDKKPVPAFTLFLYGNDQQGREALGKEAGSIAADQIPAFLVALGKEAAASGLDFDAWLEQNPGRLETLAAEFAA